MFTFNGPVSVSGYATPEAHRTCNTCALGLSGGHTPSHVEAVTAGRSTEESLSR